MKLSSLFMSFPSWIYTSTPMCLAVVWGLLALWATPPDGDRSSTRTSPGKDSDRLSLDPVPIPGPITMAHLESHMSNLWIWGRVCARRRERRGIEQMDGAPGPELLPPWKQARPWVHAGSLSVAWWA